MLHVIAHGAIKAFADNMITGALFAAVGLIVTAVLASYCEYFLRSSVTADPGKKLRNHEHGGGGKQLGVLERVLFFAAVWIPEYTIAGGWLAFKVAAKWAAWQHVIKVPDDKDAFPVRITLSSRLLGRFLNGTLFNALCAFVGAVVAILLQYLLKDFLNAKASLPILVIILAVIGTAIGFFLVLMLFRDWPDYREPDGMPQFEFTNLWQRFRGRVMPRPQQSE